MYKEWRIFRDKEYLDICPTVRAIFSLSFIHSLASRVLGYARSFGYSKNYNPTVILIMVAFCNIVTRFPDPYSFISILWVFVFIPIVKASNFAKLQDSSFNSEYQ